MTRGKFIFERVTRPESGRQAALAVAGVLGLACLAAGGVLALHHPLWPLATASVFYAVLLLAAWWPMAGLFLVPACLPWLNFAPWTGWLIVDEFDLLLLAWLAGSYLRLAHCLLLFRGPARWPRPNGLLLAWLMAGLASAAWGFLGAGGLGAMALYREHGLAALLAQGYAEPMNSLRVAKSLLWSGLAAPLLAVALRGSAGWNDGADEVTSGRQEQALAWLVRGMLASAAWVSATVLWERAAFPGLGNFSTHYRTTATFWEMHVGGGAMDVYLALMVPFVACALARARRARDWLCAALLALLVCYAVLTSFSRSLYVATVLPLLLVWAYKRLRAPRLKAWLARLEPSPQALRWRGKAGWALAALLAAEVLAVVAGGTYLRDRMSDAEGDLASRIAHWQRGLALLDTPQSWALGIGLGRLPARYAQGDGPAPDDEVTREFPGSIEPHWRRVASGQGSQGSQIDWVTLKGPLSDPGVGVLFGLTQPVAWQSRERYTVSMRFRAAGETRFLLKVCEKHLIYEGNCHARKFRVRPNAGLHAQEWQTLTVPLQPDLPFRPDAWLPVTGVLSVAVVDAGNEVQLREVRLHNSARKELTQNGDFSSGMAHWYPGAGGYYLPWHIDNLFLELLIERGVLGLCLFAALLASALKNLGRMTAQGQPLAPYLAAALGGAILVGLLSSALDVPRVAFLFLLLTLVSLLVRPLGGFSAKTGNSVSNTGERTPNSIAKLPSRVPLAFRQLPGQLLAHGRAPRHGKEIGE